MAQGRIKIEESGTVTAKMATFALTRNSTVMQQEVVSLGDPLDPTLVAEVSSQAATSSQAGLIVRTAGTVKVGPSDTNWASSAGFHFDSSGALTVASAIISTVQGAVITRSSAANMLVSVYQSTAADLNVTVAGYSTIAAVSSVGGIVAVRPTDTNWASSAGFHFDSSGALQTVASVSVSNGLVVRSSAADMKVSVYQSTLGDLRATVYQSTLGDLRASVYQSTATDLLARVNQGIGNSSVGDAWRVGPSDTNWASSAGFHFDSSGALRITDVLTSTIVQVSSLAGIVAVRPSDTNWASSAGFHFDSSGALKTVASVSVADGLVVRSSAANMLVTAYQSSAADLNVTVAGLSTTVNISSLAGWVQVTPASTAWASSAGFHFDSSGALQTAGSVSVSNGLIVRSSAADMKVSVYQSTLGDLRATVYQSTAGDLLATVRPSDTNWASSAGFHFDSSGALTILPAAGSTFNARVLQSSQADLRATIYQSTATDLLARVNQGVGNSSVGDAWRVGPSDTNWASSAGFHFDSSGALQIKDLGSTIITVSSVQGIVAVRPSDTNWASSAGFHFDSSGALQTVATVSVANGLIVRSSAADFKASVYQSTLGDLRATIYQSTAGDLLGKFGPTDTNWASSAGFHFDSSGALRAVAILTDQAGNAVETSTQSMSSGARGLFVRPVMPGSTTYAASTAGQSTKTELFSSNAATRPYVYAYSITSTAQAPITFAFTNSSGSGSTSWLVTLQAISSAISGANLAVTPPGYLFRGSTGQNLSLNVSSSNVVGYTVSVAAFRSS